MSSHRERLTAPLSWWIAGTAFAVVWGWILLVVTTWPIAITATVLIAAATLFAVWRYGSVLVIADDDGLRVGRAFVERAHVGAAESLRPTEYRHRLGVGADARGYLVTRPYLDRGVIVHLADPSDPTPYWLVSTRRPEALAGALGQTGDGAPVRAPGVTEEVVRGEEA